MLVLANVIVVNVDFARFVVYSGAASDPHLLGYDVVSLGECFFRNFEGTMTLRNVGITHPVTYTQGKTVTEFFSLTGLP